MRKFLSVLLAGILFIMAGSISFAEETEVSTETIVPDGTTVEEIAEADAVEIKYELQDEVNFHAEILSDKKTEKHFAFILYKCDGQTELGRKYVSLKDWETSFNMNFSVPEYEIGEKFIIKLFSDNAELNYNGEKGKETVLETYVTADNDGEVVYQTAFYGELKPFEESKVSLKIRNNEIDTATRIFGNEIYVSEDIIKELKINMVKEGNSWYLSSQTDGFSMRFFKDNIYATKNGTGYNLNYPVYEEDGKGFLPLYDIATYFACAIKDENVDNLREVSMEYSLYGIETAIENFVNDNGIESKTEYLIWISKSTHTVNIFTGEKGFWHHLKTYPCALGKPSTPTVEGQFEYIERLDRWNYANYYCGPVMRFYRGYALHSTLIRYNGTPYDDRVGVDISLGCIRMHPADIEELISYIPFKTKIYITKD